MGRWLERLKSKTEKGPGEGVPKVTEAPFGTYGTTPRGPSAEISENCALEDVPTLEAYLGILKAPATLESDDMPPVPPYRGPGDVHARAWSSWWDAVEAQRRLKRNHQ